MLIHLNARTDQHPHFGNKRSPWVPTPPLAALPTILKAARPFPPCPFLSETPVVPIFLFFGLIHLNLYRLSSCTSRPISKRTPNTCFITSGGLPLVIVVWSIAPWCTLKMFFAAGERMKLLLSGFEKLLSVTTDGVRDECTGVVETADRDPDASGLTEGGCTFTEGPGPGEVDPFIVLVDSFRETPCEGGVGSDFSVVGCSSSGTLPLLLALNHSITFFALLVLAALPTPGLTTSGNLLS